MSFLGTFEQRWDSFAIILLILYVQKNKASIWVFPVATTFIIFRLKAERLVYNSYHFDYDFTFLHFQLLLDWGFWYGVSCQNW